MSTIFSSFKNLQPVMKQQLWISCIISLWLFVFLLIIKPFQVDFVPFNHWFLISLATFFISFLSYTLSFLALLKLSELMTLRAQQHEIAFWGVFNIVLLISLYVFYKTDFTQGGYNLPDFIIKVYLPICIILTPLLIFVRSHSSRNKSKTRNTIVIKGENKLDILKINFSDLVYISNEQNYVSIYFVKNGMLTNKLIRTTLKKLISEIPMLIRVHRSHLINPQHVIGWRDAKTISLTQVDIPVSKTYIDSIHSYLKSAHSYQTQ